MKTRGAIGATPHEGRYFEMATARISRGLAPRTAHNRRTSGDGLHRHIAPDVGWQCGCILAVPGSAETDPASLPSEDEVPHRIARPYGRFKLPLSSRESDYVTTGGPT